MEHIIIKVYGKIMHASPALALAVKKVHENTDNALAEEGEEVFSYADNFLFFAYEGMYYPIDDMLDAVNAVLVLEKKEAKSKGVGSAESADGRIDYIDMQEWTLTRHSLANGVVKSATRSLNHVMAYSGL